LIHGDDIIAQVEAIGFLSELKRHEGAILHACLQHTDFELIIRKCLATHIERDEAVVIRMIPLLAGDITFASCAIGSLKVVRA
jgi:hypothetical protein